MSSGRSSADAGRCMLVSGFVWAIFCGSLGPAELGITEFLP